MPTIALVLSGTLPPSDWPLCCNCWNCSKFHVHVYPSFLLNRRVFQATRYASFTIFLQLALDTAKFSMNDATFGAIHGRHLYCHYSVFAEAPSMSFRCLITLLITSSVWVGRMSNPLLSAPKSRRHKPDSNRRLSFYQIDATYLQLISVLNN